MPNTVITGLGFYVPERVVKNEDLKEFMDTSDEWIQQRTGIKERHYAADGQGASDLAKEAATIALADAGLEPNDIDFIIYATLSPDHNFPGDGCFLQEKLGITNNCGALDVRNQCSGFIYGLSIGDQFIKSGMYKTILLIGSEVHSTGMDFSNRGRDTAVIFGDGAGAVILQASDEPDKGVLKTVLHAEGKYGKKLWVEYPASCENPRLTHESLDDGGIFPYMNGKYVFKHAITRMPEAVMEAIEGTEYTLDDFDLVIPHQANLRINDMVADQMKIPREKFFNNIQKYGNTTAATIPICLTEAKAEGRIKDGDLVCLTAFGAGFTWASALIKW